MWMIEEKEGDKVEALEIVELVEWKVSKTTRIRTTLSPEMRTKLVQFLKENLDVFTWSHENMPDISPKVIQHKLNVDLERKPVQQRRWVFALEQNQAITNKVNKQVTIDRLYPGGLLPWLACKCRPGEESQWELENVRGLHEPEQSLPKGYFPSFENRPASGFYSRA